MSAVLKLGGSVITDKSRPETVDAARLERAVAAIGGATGSDLVLVHGGGSFGHPAAARHGLSRTTGTHDIDAIAAVTAAMTRLNDRVVTELRAVNEPAVPIQPMGIAERSAAGELSCTPVGARRLRREGFLPVLHGDLVGHAGHGCSVASGDELAVAMGEAVDAERLGFCSAVPGVLDGAGEVIDRITTADRDRLDLTGNDGTDVTGGMATKVDALLAAEIPAAIFELDALPAFLAGEMPGTTIG